MCLVKRPDIVYKIYFKPNKSVSSRAALLGIRFYFNVTSFHRDASHRG